MIKESTTIVRIESDCLWVRGIQVTTCGSCAAKAGCGQHVLAGALVNEPLIRIFLAGEQPSDYRVGQQIEIGIPEDVIVKGSLFIYFCPLLSLLLAVGFADSVMSSELAIIAAGVAGLLLGGLVVRVASALSVNNHRLQPTIVTSSQSLVL